MAEVLTRPDDSFHLDKCECGHPRIAHYDEWLFCHADTRGKLCECEKFKKDEDKSDA